MAKAWRLMGEYNAESKTYSALAGTPAGPYVPDFNGKLVGMRVIMGRDGATSLINHVQFKLSCTTFNPNVIEVGASGNGLATAPAPQPAAVDFEVDQQVVAGVPITIEARNTTADTPVGVSVFLYGMFQT